MGQMKRALEMANHQNKSLGKADTFKKGACDKD